MLELVGFNKDKTLLHLNENNDSVRDTWNHQAARR